MLKAFLTLVQQIINHLKINFSVCIEDIDHFLSFLELQPASGR